jgi:hypothetical protein
LWVKVTFQSTGKDVIMFLMPFLYLHFQLYFSLRSVDRKEKEKMSSKIPSEGILSGISRVRLEDVEPPDISDETWTEAGKVEELFIYPVKSMRGVSVQSADVIINKELPFRSST